MWKHTFTKGTICLCTKSDSVIYFQVLVNLMEYLTHQMPLLPRTVTNGKNIKSTCYFTNERILPMETQGCTIYI